MPAFGFGPARRHGAALQQTAALTIPAVSTPPCWRNYRHDRIAKASAAKVAYLAGTANLLVAIVGDSTSMGQLYGSSASTPISAGMTGAYDRNPGAKLAGQLLNGNVEVQFGKANISIYAANGHTKQEAMRAYNQRFSVGSGWGLDGIPYISCPGGAADGAIVLSPTKPVDRHELHALAFSPPAWTVTREDGAVATLSATSDGTITTTLVQFPTATTSPVHISSSSDVYLEGWRAWNTGVKSADVVTAAYAGIKPATYNSEGNFACLSQVCKLQPQIVFVNPDLNEEQFGDSPAQLAAAIDGILAHLSADLPSATIVPVFPPATNAISDTQVQAFRDAVLGVAVNHGLMLLDLDGLFGDVGASERGGIDGGRDAWSGGLLGQGGERLQDGLRCDLARPAGRRRGVGGAYRFVTAIDRSGNRLTSSPYSADLALPCIYRKERLS